tara:strand:- start:204 stop:446 length:243 start_codon:yes stop_codon:yes gene_type:complete
MSIRHYQFKEFHMATPEKAHRTTIRLSLSLTEALKHRGAVERRSQTSILEEAGWDYLAKKGDKSHREKRIDELANAARSL